MRSPLPLSAALFAALTLSTLAPRARADLAPPPGFIESCTLEKQSGAGRECFDCSAYHGNANHCSESLAEYGFTQSCRSRGASVWSEVWCRPAGPNRQAVPKEVLGQLGDSMSHAPASGKKSKLPPLEGPPRLPVAPSSEPVAPVDPPVDTATPATPPVAAPPAPPPLPPPSGGCGGCAAPAAETAVWGPLLALGALAIGWSRRRDRR